MGYYKRANIKEKANEEERERGLRRNITKRLGFCWFSVLFVVTAATGF